MKDEAFPQIAPLAGRGSCFQSSLFSSPQFPVFPILKCGVSGSGKRPSFVVQETGLLR